MCLQVPLALCGKEALCFLYHSLLFLLCALNRGDIVLLDPGKTTLHKQLEDTSLEYHSFYSRRFLIFQPCNGISHDYFLQMQVIRLVRDISFTKAYL